MRKIFLLFIVSLVLFSCRPIEKVTEARVKVDSIALTSLNRRVFTLEQKSVFLRRKISENVKLAERFKSAMRATVEKYDTSKPNNPIKEKITYSKNNSRERSYIKLKHQVDSLVKISKRKDVRIEKLERRVTFLEEKEEKTKTLVGPTEFQSFQIWGFWILLVLMLVIIFVKFK